MHQQLTAEEKIISARIKLLMDQPFFGNIASRIDTIPSDKYPIGATNGYEIFYNPKAIEKLPISKVIFFYAHEVLHIVLEHFLRMQDRNVKIWNFATDYASNSILKKNKIGTPIEGTLYEKKYDNLSSEEIYEDLTKSIQTLDFENLSKMLLDTHLSGLVDKNNKPRSKEDIEKISNEIKKFIIESAQACKNCASIPIGMERLVNSIVNPQLSWQDLLKNFFLSKKKCDFSFNRFNKRNSLGNIIFPSMKNENEINICIACDSSGSISEKAISKFMAEINEIVREFNSWKIKLWSFDTEIYQAEDFSSDENDDISSFKIKGCGGTDFNCNWDFLKEEGIIPDVLIIFTDMLPNFGWGDPDYCDTLFINYSSEEINAPFGETFHLK